ncbi:pyridoxamine 5'-phosphate oxidase family protein [Haloglomus litoreum]|uniref:pyridoxamine 5'-phosphate oxidase family protein n=1 Tax=Haloglomus litoreum TaxID=3034026 RepID=UPI0023E819C0|nr:pyridoxamine 5'-phosphate oxidase family protein [Haloglomus sp. DT116]
MSLDGARLDLDHVRQAVHDSPAAEVATAAGDRPRTYPLSPFYDEEREAVVVTSPPAYAGKVDTVRENPKLSLLFYDADEPFVLYGRGTVRDDDLEANAEYVQDLIRSEPPSEKREGFTKTSSVLDSRIGRFLFGWYALRLVVEVEPVRVEPLGDARPGSLPPWPEQGIDTTEAESYDRLALTVVDEDGWPTTRTVRGVERQGADTLALETPLPVTDGQSACLLCHWHTPDLSKLGQRLFRGRVSTTDGADRVRFEPGSSTSMRNATLLDRLKFIWTGKRRTRAYFRRQEEPGA